ncbi:transmembrane protein 17-like isoform X2 [Mobula birostris]|uniref:transmembrane protein 17-like isoform X2 n=1 Tax=Mobula birostris TaxID=1983395 RepID=UPI003B282CF3
MLIAFLLSILEEIASSPRNSILTIRWRWRKLRRIICWTRRLYEYLSTYYQITLIALILVMTLVEVVRLYLGYVGNLQEKVPQLAGSWLLTLLLQLPMLLFQLLTPHLWVLPAEWASSLLYLALLLSQALLALLALRRLASQLEARFRLSHLRLGEAWGPSAAPPSWRGRGQF